MTDVDTAAIREAWPYPDMYEEHHTIALLCDALDEARAEVERLRHAEMDLGARILEAADELGPAIGATVGGRGLVTAIRQVLAERSSAQVEVRQLREWNASLRADLDSARATIREVEKLRDRYLESAAGTDGGPALRLTLMLTSNEIDRALTGEA